MTSEVRNRLRINDLRHSAIGNWFSSNLEMRTLCVRGEMMLLVRDRHGNNPCSWYRSGINGNGMGRWDAECPATPHSSFFAELVRRKCVVVPWAGGDLTVGGQRTRVGPLLSGGSG
jgi:hypothetical protein